MSASAFQAKDSGIPAVHAGSFVQPSVEVAYGILKMMAMSFGFVGVSVGVAYVVVAGLIRACAAPSTTGDALMISATI
jgi:hypothetical protein